MFNKLKIIQDNFLLKLILINIYFFFNFSNIYCIERESQFLTSNNTSSSFLLMVGIGLIGFSIGYGLCYLYNRSVNQNNINSNLETNQDLNNINSNSDVDQDQDQDQNNINSNSDVDQDQDQDQNNINSNLETNQDLNNINLNSDINQNNINSNPETNQDLNNININSENLISEDLTFIGPSNFDILQLGLDQLININDLFHQNHFNLQYLTDLPLLQISNLSNTTTELNNVVCLLNSIQKQNMEIYKLLDNINSLYLLYLNGN